MMEMNKVPSEIKLHQKSRRLEVIFDDQPFFLSCEYLRVYSQSAEVKGHGPGQEILQVGKENVNITHIEPVGSYGIKPTFSDGHNTGIYSWDYLYDLAVNQEQRWLAYLDKLVAAGHARVCEQSDP